MENKPLNHRTVWAGGDLQDHLQTRPKYPFILNTGEENVLVSWPTTEAAQHLENRIPSVFSIP